jgi:CDP-diacylglycerol--serine O-phosphatidyltransferase
MYFRTMQFRRLLPNALTMGNLLSGVLVIVGLIIWPLDGQINSMNGDQLLEFGALSPSLYGQGMLTLSWIWILGQVCDLLDGIAARWTKTAGPMGVQLDSLADLVSSGIAPSVVGIAFMHAWAAELPTAIKFLPLTMALAAAWRLARFNVEANAPKTKPGFSGMPAPAGALYWIGVLLTAAQFEMHGSYDVLGLNGTVAVVGSVLVGSSIIPLLLISRVPMLDLKGWKKNPPYDRKRALWFSLLIIVGTVVAISTHAIGLGLQAALLLYVLGGKIIVPSTQT